MSLGAWSRALRGTPRKKTTPVFRRGRLTPRRKLTLRRPGWTAKPRRGGKPEALNAIVSVVFAFAFALSAGLGSAWYAIERGLPFSVEHIGPWTSWPNEGNPSADPYTKAHLARTGRLPLTSSTARYFAAKTDSAGAPISAACEYTLEGGSFDAQWWTITLYDEAGRLIENPANRYGYNSAEIIRRSDGGYLIDMARTARSENWIPIAGDPSRKLMLMLRIYGLRVSDESGTGQIDPDGLPTIRRRACA